MSKKTGLTPTKVWHLAVKEKSIRYYLQGNTTLKAVAERISQELPRACSYSMVYNCIQEGLKEWADENADAIADYKKRELLNIEFLQREAWNAWERSCLPEKVRQSKSVPVQKAAGSRSKKPPTLILMEVIDSEREGVGNKRFLDTVQWCITKRLEIMASMQTPTADADKPGTITNNTTIRQIVFKGRRQEGAIQTVIINNDK